VRPVVLIVEDEAPLLQLLGETVGRFGYDLRLAATAGEALILARIGRPDVILLDLFLPDAAGTSTFEDLHAILPDVPIIILTANADELLAQTTLRLGAFDYIMKPFNVEQLHRVLEAAIAASGGGGRPS
jgi:DNA-binding response OmpR family regulator